jgi:hypothetical protein
METTKKHRQTRKQSLWKGLYNKDLTKDSGQRRWCEQQYSLLKQVKDPFGTQTSFILFLRRPLAIGWMERLRPRDLDMALTWPKLKSVNSRHGPSRCILCYLTDVEDTVREIIRKFPRVHFELGRQWKVTVLYTFCVKKRFTFLTLKICMETTLKVFAIFTFKHMI